jgi:protein SCO1/2
VKARISTLAVVLLAALVAGCGGSGSGKSGKPDVETKPSPFQGAVADPPKPAPPLKLKDSTGKAFDLASFKGKAVLVTFLYVHCPDICPTIAANLHTSLKLLGPQASRVQVVAVSTDPRGDTPKTVKTFLSKHRVQGEMRYLIASKSKLAAVWKQWGIVAKTDRTDPDQVEHSAPIYGIAASGKITTLYPANFKPAQIVHDVPILAKQ